MRWTYWRVRPRRCCWRGWGRRRGGYGSGSGGIMLPHYSAFKVAEVFRTLHALYPGRVDLGIGRAPGGGPLEMLALKRDRKSKMLDDFPEQVLSCWLTLRRIFRRGIRLRICRCRRRCRASRMCGCWGRVCGAGAAAVEFGLPYAFAHFFSPVHTRAAIESYMRGFIQVDRPGARKRPEATVAVGVICAETQEEADFLHASVRLLQRRIRVNDRRPVAARRMRCGSLGCLGMRRLRKGSGGGTLWGLLMWWGVSCGRWRESWGLGR